MAGLATPLGALGAWDRTRRVPVETVEESVVVSTCIGSDEAGAWAVRAWAVPVVGVESECPRCAVDPWGEGASPTMPTAHRPCPCVLWGEGASPTMPLRLPLRAMKNEATCPPARGDGGGSGVVASAQLFEPARPLAPLAPLAPSIPSSSASLTSNEELHALNWRVSSSSASLTSLA